MSILQKVSVSELVKTISEASDFLKTHWDTDDEQLRTVATCQVLAVGLLFSSDRFTCLFFAFPAVG